MPCKRHRSPLSPVLCMSDSCQKARHRGGRLCQERTGVSTAVFHGKLESAKLFQLGAGRVSTALLCVTQSPPSYPSMMPGHGAKSYSPGPSFLLSCLSLEPEGASQRGLWSGRLGEGLLSTG